MTKLLIVEDSQVDRTVLNAVLKQHLPYCQLYFAHDAFEARELIAFEEPQVVLLDLELPRMSGEQFLRLLMENHPLPVIVICRAGENTKQLASKLKAIGAIAVLQKPRNRREIAPFSRQLRTLLCESIGVCPVTDFNSDGPSQTSANRSEAAPKTMESNQRPSLIAIGASTGGPPALEAILKHLDQNCPPVLIAQHIAKAYIHEFAKRLDRITKANVQVAKTGQRIREGHIYLGPPEKQIRLTSTGVLLIDNTDESQSYAPSINVLFHSLVGYQPKSTVAVLLTGMGEDGASGMLKLRLHGATTIAQNETSSVVFGMPKRAIDLGGAQHILHLSAIGPVLKKWIDVGDNSTNTEFSEALLR